MRTGFVSRVGPLPVERLPGVIRTHSSVNLSAPRTAGIHTTEGSWDSALRVFQTRLTTPTFMVGEKSGKPRIGQGCPLGEMAASFENDPGGVETNRLCVAQIEVVGFSKQQKWLPPAATLEALVQLLAFLEDQCDVPIDRPWLGHDLGPLPWAVESYPRRRSGKWGKVAGWFGHVEIPENAHWDPGELDYPTVLERVRQLDRPRTLRLTTPAMVGEDVVAAKRLLEDNKWGRFVVGNTDLIWGMEAAQATHAAKWFLGYPKDQVNGIYGPVVRQYLAGEKRLPADYRARRATRLANYPFRKALALDSSRAVHPS